MRPRAAPAGAAARARLAGRRRTWDAGDDDDHPLARDGPDCLRRVLGPLDHHPPGPGRRPARLETAQPRLNGPRHGPSPASAPARTGAPRPRRVARPTLDLRPGAPPCWPTPNPRASGSGPAGGTAARGVPTAGG